MTATTVVVNEAYINASQQDLKREKREENEHIKVKRTKAGGKLSLKLPKHINNFDDITRIIYCVLECWI